MQLEGEHAWSLRMPSGCFVLDVLYSQERLKGVFACLIDSFVYTEYM